MCRTLRIFNPTQQEDNVQRREVENLVDTFPGQSIDFFGALRARVYDDMVRQWITDTGVDKIGQQLVNARQKVAMPKVSHGGQVCAGQERRRLNRERHVGST